MPQTGGSKANSRRRHEMFLETGEYPTRGKMFIETHKRNDGLFVNNEARTIVVSSALEQIELTQGNANESKIFSDDIIGKVLGAEHSGRVQCMGMGAAPSNTSKNIKQRLNGLNHSSSSFGTSSATFTYLQQEVTHLKSQLVDTLQH
ncbi:uncharacterized protein LOC107798691 isoform X1 [Nicotiana tabacum]|uniref:Uncharacterized protein isoform X1 n=7 Tax=Nicotiana tabacum TaxID=4097 RepID=A0A1S4AKH2_TOBAC|nr:PREDICTED: uncharacterized protein LOC107798691 isoform X1 [Nicotiana tabacum]XP_016477205.1 PREDICTED: uncharacterized protein LOC107798691 isoform X1 [Nicotiana tabacum]